MVHATTKNLEMVGFFHMNMKWYHSAVQKYFLVISIIFSLVAVAHVWRLMTQQSILIGQWHVPMFISVLGFIVPSFLAVVGFRYAKRCD